MRLTHYPQANTLSTGKHTIIRLTHYQTHYPTVNTDMIFVKNFTRPEFLGPRFYPKKCVNRDNDKFTTKQRKFFKLLNLRQNSVMLQYNILANIQLSQETLGQLKISQDE